MGSVAEFNLDGSFNECNEFIFPIFRKKSDRTLLILLNEEIINMKYKF